MFSSLFFCGFDSLDQRSGNRVHLDLWLHFEQKNLNMPSVFIVKNWLHISELKKINMLCLENRLYSMEMEHQT